jgi:DNA-binding NtrC family response regulator
MKNINVLVVGNQENMSEVFMENGMSVIKVASLIEAREALKLYVFEVVVTDVTVPMMDGIEIAKLVYADLPVVAISNNSDHSSKFSNICDCIIEKLDIDERLYLAALKAIERRNMGLAFAA